MSAEELKQKFYELACDFDINVGTKSSSIALRGLSENMLQAMALMENFIAHAKADAEAYAQYIALETKFRNDNKLSQESNFNALRAYGTYGPYNQVRNIPSSQELKEMNPQMLVDKIKAFGGYKHTVLYYGPMELNELIASVDSNHPIAASLADAPTGKPYTLQPTPKNEVFIAPYDAKNIYMIQYHNENRAWDATRQPVIDLFNEYFGGGMNTVVFQELREARGLAYSAGANYATPAYKGMPEYAMTFIISQNDKMTDCIRTFNEIIDTMPQSDKAFELAKQALLKRLATARTTKMGIINAYLNAKHKGIDYDINEKVYNAVTSLTLDNIARFEKEAMANKPYRYLILGNEKELDMKALEKIGPVKRLSTEEIFGY